MAKWNFTDYFACPRCKRPLKPVKNGNCAKCKFNYSNSDGIWNFLYSSNREGVKSMRSYDLMHKEDFGGPNDGSYEILASIARGNKTLDIACGEGLIEKLAPDTIGLEFSLNALRKAKKNGAKHLVLADAQNLPFRDNVFDLTISAGSLEHFSDPAKAISEMARVSRIQILTVHKELPFPFANLVHEAATKLMSIKHQPIEQPISRKKLEQMLKKANLHIVFKGFWTLPLNYGRVIKFLPEFNNTPSCLFYVTIKNLKAW